MSRVDELNDAYEDKRVIEPWNDKIFVSSFTHRNHESNMFWEVYAKEKGVMLEFDNRYINCDNLIVYSDSECKNPFMKYERSDISYTRNQDYNDWLLRDAVLCDIIYTDNFDDYMEEDVELKEFFKDTVMISKSKDFKFPINPGLVKGIEWDNEEESRLRVTLSYKGLSNHSKNGSPATPFIHVYIKLGEDLLDNLTITLNPWCDDELEKEVYNIVERYLNIEKVNIKKSTMTSQVKNKIDN